MKRAIYDGVLLLDESLPYEVVELPLPRDSPVELLEPESGPPKEPHGRNAAEKRERRSWTASMPTAKRGAGLL